tara:strand:- start:25 stop:195 length:171 start_codon:yes stop_codon:yes gene_type:complete
MKTYSAYVYGGTGRRVLVEAESQQEAEVEAIEEFKALLGADGDIEVIDISELEEKA